MINQRHRPSLTGYSHRTRGEALQGDFLVCLDMIELHQEMFIPPGYMSDYQALGWIAVSEGVPQITTAGMAVVRSLHSHQAGRRHAGGSHRQAISDQ